ncbi:MAG: VWA domain-containing protein [Verrucomicrobia bacterium]|nr:VWA domain-containing protein [Verrucomicrobiota bacterium]
MSFYWPHAFWLLLVPLAFLVRDLFRRRTASAAPHPKIQQAEVRRSSLVLGSSSLRRGGVRVRIFLILGLVFGTLALARPQWGRLEEPVFDQAREILIALDLSRSMLSQDVKPSRLDRARLLITSLLEQLKGERVGLVVFSGTAFLQSPLSADYEILREFLPQLGPDFLPEGGTDYNALLETSLSAFGSSGAADRFLIVLSDGEAQSDDWHKHVAELKTKGIRVLSLGVGTAGGAMIPDGAGAFMKDERGAVVLSKLNNATLRELADKTGGVYTDASSWVDLPQLIQATVDQGKRGEFRETSRVRLAERFQWALAPALLLLAISFWREFPVRPKPRALTLSHPPKPASATGSLATLALLFCLAPWFAGHAAFAAEASSDPLSAPLTQLVGQLAARDTIDARDYAGLARSTLSYGQRLTETQQPVPAGPVNDALAAVAAGRTLDPKAADWPALAKQLEALLQKKNPPEQKKPDQPPPDKKPSDQKKDDADPKKDQKNQDSKNDSSQSKDQDKSSSPSQPQNAPSKSKDGKDDSSSGKPDSPSGQPKQPQSAFGDMKDKKSDQPPGEPKPSDTPPPAPGEMQQVGGASEKTGEASPTDPALALPLQKLDQVRQQDSPARLFQLLQDPAPATPAPKGHNW